MPFTRRALIKGGVAAAAGLAGRRRPIEPGRFEPTWDSLAQYRCPEWFRDAKFGIWAHWTAQCVPEQGDWYARQMYQQGNPDYNFQCAHYGHPSRIGFKDIDHLWRGENWNPAELIRLYKAAGAKYFVALANHHDNFDCFHSAHQPWNSVAIGPHKDIVGTWAAHAREQGLRFGVTSHASHAWSWFEVAQGADSSGPLKGVPYDGRLTRADGAGQWWEGLDPQDLYAQNHAPGRDLVWDWDRSRGSSIPDAAYIDKFHKRVLDLLDKYHPDLLYFDDDVLPLYPISDVGLQIAASFYNDSLARHGGRLEAVLNGKNLNAQQAQCMVHDFERGRSDRVAPQPWQTDTCIGEWHYRRSLYENHQYKTVEQVVRMLVDIVSKNGNLLLNIPVRGDGTIDPDETAFLHGLADWIAVNGEAIYHTRPWTVAGEGPVRIRGGGFSEGGEAALTAADFRFTTRGDTLYATAMGWPESGRLMVRTLAEGAPGVVGTIERVQLLGHTAPLRFNRTSEGLVAELPPERPCDHAYVLKISGLKTQRSRPVPLAAAPIRADASGAFRLTAETADLHGSKLHLQSGSENNIGFWDDPAEYLSWRLQVDQPGRYRVTIRTATASGASALQIAAGPERPIAVQIPQTGDWNRFQEIEAGTISLPVAGTIVLSVRPESAAQWRPVNLSSVTLTRIPNR